MVNISAAYNRSKLRHLVQFPIRGLDLSAYVAQKTNNTSTAPAAAAAANNNSMASHDHEFAVPHAVPAQQRSAAKQSTSSSSNNSNSNSSSSNNASQAHQIISRVGTDGMYDLYAVVHHLGAMSAGSYTEST